MPKTAHYRRAGSPTRLIDTTYLFQISKSTGGFSEPLGNLAVTAIRFFFFMKGVLSQLNVRVRTNPRIIPNSTRPSYKVYVQ